MDETLKNETAEKDDGEVIYIMGESKKLVIQNFLHELESFDISLVQVAPSPFTLSELPSSQIHMIVCLNEEIDTSVLHSLKNYTKKNNWHVYFIRNDVALSATDEIYIKETSPFMFKKQPINIDKFFKAYNWSNLERKRILVVDDDPIVLRQIKALLGNTYDVYLVNSGSAALEFLGKHEVELVLLDFEMPEMNGPSVLRLLRNNPETAKLPVYFLTAKGDRESILTALQQKPNGYILKSRPPEEITMTICDFFNRYIIDYE